MGCWVDTGLRVWVEICGQGSGTGDTFGHRSEILVLQEPGMRVEDLGSEGWAWDQIKQ